MTITKFGHSCLLLEQNGSRILIDPGIWSEGYAELKGLNAILITHIHQDHCDPRALKLLRENNPDVLILTSAEVGMELSKEGIPFDDVREGDVRDINGIPVEVYGHDHAVIYGSVPCVNTGFLIDGRLYHPGDAFFVPSVIIDILALPVCAPWMKTSEAIDFAKEIKPQVCFPIHDGMLKHAGPFHQWVSNSLSEQTEFRVLEQGIAYEFPSVNVRDMSKNSVEGGAGQEES